MATVLAIGAHFDDVEVGVGGTLAKHVAIGDKVFIAVVDSQDDRAGNPTVRLEEQYAALGVLGLRKSDLLIFAEFDRTPNIVARLDVLYPDIVYTMFESDTHQAHRRCSVIGQAVGRKLPTGLIFYTSGSSYDFHPNLFSVIDFIPKKTLLECFKSQVSSGVLNIGAVRRRESYWASLISTIPEAYAEGFLVRKLRYEIRRNST
jgi:two-component system, NtrC family, response regulator HydG